MNDNHETGQAQQRNGETTLADYVEHHAHRHPEVVALRVDDDALTYGQLHAQVEQVAAGLAAAGVATGDTVALMLPNCAEFVVTWLALNRIGAAAAAVNTSLSEASLTHTLNQTRARIAVASKDLLPALAAALHQLPHLQTVYLRGAEGGDLGDVRVLQWSALAAAGEVAPRLATAPSDTSIVLFTSGSTSRSKGCLLPHRYVLRQAEIFNQQLGIRPDDVLFCPFPLFHADAAIFTVAPAFLLGATAALASRFSASRFWDQIRHHRATVFDFMGATLTMLHKQPTRDDDADNPARLGWGVPLPAWALQFEARFGVELVEVYGLSDTGIVLYNTPGQPRRTGSCGRPVYPFDVQILDPTGHTVPTGSTGEICIRPQEPDVIMTGYMAMPEETLAAFRNLWFHTGDLAYRDDDGYIFFVGRTKDIIRRRGENISAFEIEEVVGAHPAVAAAAAFGVPSELSEEDIMVAAVQAPGKMLTAQQLVTYCEQHLPRHMVPRYIDIVTTLPFTPTEKVEKHLLKAAGVTPSTYDREAAGRPMIISREYR
jgi:crotonobetaine/carnitine-CoA ligase